MKNLLNKYHDIVLYVLFGVMTTIVNIIVFAVCRDTFHMDITLSNIIAWVWSVLFAYITNKKWVFHSTNGQWLKEMLSFYGSRVATLLIETVLLFVLINLISVGEMYAKIFSNVIVIILNYILSKVFVFSKNR